MTATQTESRPGSRKHKPSHPNAKYLNRPAVLIRYTMSKSKLYELMSGKLFPRPRATPFGPRWAVADLEAFDATLKAA